MTHLKSLCGRKLARSNFKAIAVSLALIGAFAANEPANAALVLPVLYLPPVAPILRTPGAGQTIETNVNDARPTLVWRHGALYFGYPRPMTPTHFAVCMFDAAAPITCTYAASAWKPAVGGVPSVPSGSVIYGTAGQYEYTYQLPSAVSSSLLDKQIRWSVGACVVPASPTPPTCTFATPVDLWLSTKNIIGHSISTSSSVGRDLYFEGLVKNPGTTPIAGPVYTTINIYNTLMTDGELCLQDPNDTIVKLTDQVVTYAGRLITVSTLPLDGQGKRVAPVDGVSGIYRPTAWRLPSVSSFLAVSGTIPAGRVLSNGSTVPGLATVFAFTIQAPASQPVPAAYTAVMTPDYFNDVREWNESDNAKAQCHVIH